VTTPGPNQIDALFGAGGGGAGPATAAPVRRSEVRPYDFRRPNLISKDHMRALQAMYGTLVKTLEGWVNARTRGDAELHLISVDQLTFGEFVMTLTNPCSSFIYDVSNAAQQAVIDFGREFAFFLVDRLLGANGVPYVLERPLTSVERMIVRIVADWLVDQLRETWGDYVSLAFELDRFESIPDMLHAANREDPVLVANVLARTAGLESPLYVCLPFAILEKFFTNAGFRHHRVAHTNPAERAAELAQIERTLRTVSVSVTARLPEFAVSLSELRALASGHMLLTGLAADAPVTLYIEGQPRFVGTSGNASGTLAIRVDQASTGPTAGGASTVHRNPIIMQNNEPVPAGAGASTISELQAAGTTLPPAALSSLMTVTLPVSIELGRTRMTLQEIMELGRGSLVQLDRLVGEPIDVMVGDRHFAQGEVVVMGEQFGVRITRIMGAPATTETP